MSFTVFIKQTFLIYLEYKLLIAKVTHITYLLCLLFRKGMYLDAVLVVNTSRSSTYTFRSPHADDMHNLINYFLKYFNSPNTAGSDD